MRWYLCPACGKHLLRDSAVARNPAFCSRMGVHVRLRLLPEGNSVHWTHRVSPKKGKRKTIRRK